MDLDPRQQLIRVEGLRQIIVGAMAQPAEHQEGDLTAFANRDTKDVQQRLELLTHTLYSQQQEIIAILFHQEHGDRVKMKMVWIGARDKSLVPAWIFTPLKMDAGKRYPAIVMVHGGFHEHFDERFFKKVDMAISRGYVVIFPEYRGSREQCGQVNGLHGMAP